jgi:ParB family chromosome partitioning protein
MAKFILNQLLNDQSKSDSARLSETGFEIHQIPIDKIIPSESNKYGIRDIEELAASIETLGLQQNLVVKEANADGQHEIISGERRYQACKLLFVAGNQKYATLPCIIEPGGNSVLDELKLIHANAMTRVLTDYEKTYQAGRIKELLQELKTSGYKFQGRMREIVAGILSVSSSQVGRMESINDHLNPELTEEFKKENIGITQAYNLSTLPPDAQASAAKELKTTGSIDLSKQKEKPVRTNPKAEFKASMENRDCRYGGKCTNAENLSSFLINGNLSGCAGCCDMCIYKTTCDRVCAIPLPKPEPKQEPEKNEVGSGPSEAAAPAEIIPDINSQHADDHQGKWSFNRKNCEIWDHDSYSTKEEAIKGFYDYYGEDVFEGMEFEVGQYEDVTVEELVDIDIDYIFDHIADTARDMVGEVGEDYLNDVSRADGDILESRIREVVVNWIKEFEYEPTFYRVTNIETVIVGQETKEGAAHV